MDLQVWELWLPILLTGLGTHIASTLAWMVLPHHKPEWKKMPAEDEFLDFLDQKQVPAQQFMFPFCDDMKQASSPEFKQKQEARCNGLLILWPKPVNMGQAIGKTLAFFFVAAFLIGYVASIAFSAGETDKLDIFALTFTTAALCHAAGPFPGVFWFRKYFAMEVLDGVVYALLTATIFTLLWPAAS